MNIERVRSILGVWAPMAIGVFIIVTSVNFYFNANLTNGLFVGDLGSWRLVCSAGASSATRSFPFNTPLTSRPRKLNTMPRLRTR